MHTQPERRVVDADIESLESAIMLAQRRLAAAQVAGDLGSVLVMRRVIACHTDDLRQQLMLFYATAL